MSNRQEIPFKTLWAENAETTIPATPVIGDSYRDEATTDVTVGDGWAYGDPVPSQSENQYNYIQSLITRQLSVQGVLSYSDKEDYSASVGAVVMDDGVPYLCLQDNGPASAIKQPSTEPLYWRDFASNQFAQNKIKTSQFVVAGRTGTPLPEFGLVNSYAIGDELAFGWIAQTAVVDATKDSNGNLTATSGVVRYEIDKDENDTISEMIGSVMNYDGTKYTQIFADGANGLTVNDTPTSWQLDVDLSLVSGIVFGLSETFGKLNVDSVKQIKSGLYSDLLIARKTIPISAISGVNYKNETDVEEVIYFSSSLAQESGSKGRVIVNGITIIQNAIDSSVTGSVSATFTVLPGDIWSITYSSLPRAISALKI